MCTARMRFCFGGHVVIFSYPQMQLPLLRQGFASTRTSTGTSMKNAGPCHGGNLQSVVPAFLRGSANAFQS